MAAYVPHPFHGNPKAYLWNELNRIAVAISGGGITNLSPASSAVVLTPNPILGAGTIGVSANLNAYSGGDTPSAFTLGIVDSVDAAAWRAAIGAGTSSAAGANPSASVGLAAVNGAATTFLRSDGAPPLSQAISPTWTGEHKFAGDNTYSVATTYAQLGAAIGVPRLVMSLSTASANNRLWDQLPTNTTYSIRTVNDAASDARYAWTATRSGVAITGIEYGNTTDNPSHTFYGPATFGYDASNFGAIQVVASGATIGISDTGSPADGKKWRLTATTSAFLIGVMNDAESVFSTAFQINRSTTAITTLTYGNSTDLPTHTFYGPTIKNGGTGVALTINGVSGQRPLIVNQGSSGLTQFHGNAGANAGIEIVQDGQTSWSIYQPASSNDLRWSNGTDKMFLDSAGKLTTTASASASSGLRLPHGAAPSAPVDGDMWTTTAGLFVRINGATVGPLN